MPVPCGRAQVAFRAMSEQRERLFLLDGTALAYRAYFAFLRARLSDQRGRPTGAVYGFVATLLRLLKEEQPDHIGVCFDPPGPTFRHERYPEYKATRERMDDDLRAQMPVLREVVRAFNIPVLEVPGFEADDVLGTVAASASQRGIETYIVTGDKDLCQCVDEHVRIYNILKPGEATEVLDEAGVTEAWGVPPNRVIDVLALMGDASDNVPGVPGIGKKTAVKLINAIGSVADILAVAEADDKSRIKSDNMRAKLRDHRDLAVLSLELVTIDAEVPVDVAFDDLRLGDRNEDEVTRLFQELNFTRLLQRITAVSAKQEEHDYRIVKTDTELAAMIETLRKSDLVSVDSETTGLDPLRAQLVGLSFSVQEQTGWYVPFNLDGPLTGGGLFDGLAGPSEDAKRFLETLRPFLEDPNVRKTGQNAKYDVLALRTAGIDVQGYVFDTMIASFVLDPGARQHNLDALALRHFGYKKIPTSELIGSGKKQTTMDQLPVDQVGEYACEDADFTYRLARRFEPRIADESVGDLFRDVEMPLLPVLADMEWSGVRIDVDHLATMSTDLLARSEALKAQIWEIAGKEFNVNSPKQLGPILFDELGIQGRKKVRKTRGGDYATDERTLSVFAEAPVVSKLLDYRSLVKLRGTYTEALPKLVNPRTGRLHTSYSQVGAITGRLASSDPNLQNIPIRTEDGRQIRRAFVPRGEGWSLLSSDYSQIELRILAHLSEDKALCAAFERGEDIHTATASRVFGFAPALVTPEVRSRAKAINFGIVYGMGATRLAQDTGMTRKEASAFIEAYFNAYPGVNAYLEKQKGDARANGVVSTLLGRIRDVRGLYESDRPRIQATADNVAVNTPIQGSAADIIKVAMIRLHRRLAADGLQSKMLLQVHDELVFDVAPGELETVSALVKSEMEGAHELRVPLLVDMGHGPDWLTAH